MGCKHLRGCAVEGDVANSNANSAGPAPDMSYALYGPEHIAFVVKRARALVSDVIHAMGLGTVSKEALLNVASDHLKFLDEVMADSLPVLGEARFRKRFVDQCACRRETSGQTDSPKPSKPSKPSKTSKLPKPSRPAKAKGGRHG